VRERDRRDIERLVGLRDRERSGERERERENYQGKSIERGCEREKVV
jgi:hypothetical protein